MDVSVIVCTYNPNERIFRKCLEGLAAQHTGELRVQGLIIDNNSNPPLEGLDYVREFLAAHPNYSVVPEKRPGLTYARLAGISRAQGGICIFVDDDNELAGDYIREAYQTGVENPDVGAWGPSKITVVYEAGAPAWANKLKKQFQQKEFDFVKLTDSRIRNRSYPVGTGMVVRKPILDDYAGFINSRTSVVRDRTAGSLSSGGDLQIAMMAVQKGYSVGIFPTLRLNHHIPLSRLNMAYMRKRIYGCAVSYEEALIDMMPEFRGNLAAKSLSDFQVLKALFGFLIRKNFRVCSRESQLELATILGLINGIRHIEGKPYSRPVRFLVQRMKLE